MAVLCCALRASLSCPTTRSSPHVLTRAAAARRPRPPQIAYIIDTPRCVGPQTFMTNMLQVGAPLGAREAGRVQAPLPRLLPPACAVRRALAVHQAAPPAQLRNRVLPHPYTTPLHPHHHTAAQACSILYKMRLPVLLVFNKVDVARHEFALDWMADFDNFHQARGWRWRVSCGFLAARGRRWLSDQTRRPSPTLPSLSLPGSLPPLHSSVARRWTRSRATPQRCPAA